jgi:hypothetical protein
MSADFKVEGTQALEQLAADLKKVADGKVLRKSLTKRLGAAVKPLVPEIRSAVKAIPSKGSGGSASASRSAMSSRASGGLRDAIARAVQQKTSLSGQSVGVRLRVDSTKMPADQRSLPAMLEGITPWRHPTFGHEPWVPQEAHPYFYKTITPHLDQVENEVAQVLNDVAKAIGYDD